MASPKIERILLLIPFLGFGSILVYCFLRDDIAGIILDDLNMLKVHTNSDGRLVAFDSKPKDPPALVHDKVKFRDAQNTGDRAERTDPPGLAPCGQICSYDGTIVNSSTGSYPQWRKDINCDRIMQRMSFTNHRVVYPPPETPPKEMVEAFTMFGEMPIKEFLYFKDQITDDKHFHFTTERINNFIERLENDENINKYNGGKCVQDILKNYISSDIQGRHGAVIGTLAPWLEAMLVSYGARNVTTLEYADITYDDPKLNAFTPYEFAAKYLRGEVGQFDFGATFSSLEHSGLGRFTDPLNPYGDLEAMAQVWCMTKPGGMFAVGVPDSKEHKSYIIWNAHRAYGPNRLEHLTANWEVVEFAHCASHHFVVLRKPSS